MRSPMKPIALTEKALAMFPSRVDRRGADECWPWTGHTDRNGYGTFAAPQFFASRVAWFLANGRQPTGYVCHSCDNPICVNPAHLWLGDALSNARDMIQKGRHRSQRKDVCKSGHGFTPENTYWHNGRRACRSCNRVRQARCRAAKADAQKEAQ